MSEIGPSISAAFPRLRRPRRPTGPPAAGRARLGGGAAGTGAPRAAPAVSTAVADGTAPADSAAVADGPAFADDTAPSDGMAPADDAVPAEDAPISEPGPPPPSSDDEDTGEIPLIRSAPGDDPPAGAGAATSGDRGRRLRIAALVGVTVAAVGAAGVTYAVLDQSGQTRSLAGRPPVEQQVPTVDPGFPGGGLPAADPPGNASTDPTDPARPTDDQPGPGAVGADGEWPPVAGPDDSDPEDEPDPPDENGAPPPGNSPPRLLTATLTRQADLLAVGLVRYRGTVRLVNAGPTAISGWRVSLTVPGGKKVRKVKGADHDQDGQRVVFSPDDDAPSVPAGGTVTFTFRIRGLLPREPSNCTVNGRPCS